jgi:hypothetical protein
MKQRTHSLSLAVLGLLAMSAHAAVPARLLGDLVPPGQATRVIRIEPSTRYVNARWGDTVAFVSHGKEFAYRFDGAPGRSAFDLRQVAPAGTLDHEVTAYIEGSDDTP